MEEGWIIEIIREWDIDVNLQDLIQNLFGFQENMEMSQKKKTENSRNYIEKYFDQDKVRKIDTIPELTTDIIDIAAEKSRSPYRFVELEVENFRQFYGIQTVALRTGESNRINVIEGENGSGKTNFLNAITWCLFEKEYDTSSEIKETSPFNIHKLEQLDENEIGIMRVKLTFDRKSGQKVQFVRKSEFIRKGNESRKKGKTDFDCYTTNSINDPLKPYPQADAKVRQIIPPEIHRFFFFDAEHVTRFFEPGNESEVHSAIQEVARFNTLDKLMTTIERVKTRFAAKKTGLPEDKEIEELTAKIDDYTDKIERYKDLILKLREQKRINDQNLSRKQTELKQSGYKQVELLQKEKEGKQNELTSKNNRINEINEQLKKHLFNIMPILLTNDIFEPIIDKIDNKYEAGELPPNIRPQFVRSLLERKKCICNRPLESNEQIEALRQLGNIDDLSELEGVLIEIRSNLQNMTENVKEEISEFLELFDKIVNARESYRQTNEVIDDLNKKLERIDHANIQSIQSSITKLERNKTNIEIDLSRTRSDLEKAERDRQIDERNLDKLLKGQNKRKKINQLRDLCDNLVELLQALYDKLMEHIRTNLANKSTNYFKILAWKEDFKQNAVIEISENYAFDLKIGVRSMMIDLSAGEKQIVAISFIAALTWISGFEAPIIIDSPLNRISESHRKNIAESLPNFLEGSQLMLLVTPDEYTSDVSSILGDHVSNYYHLSYDTNTSTTTLRRI